MYLGVTVLKRGELHMYEFFYDELAPNLNGLVLHSMDTDSFILSLIDGSVVLMINICYLQEKSIKNLKGCV